MAKTPMQKRRILYVMQMLTEQTDEEHPISTAQIIKNLNLMGIEAERKSIYDDIETLQTFGLDILSRRSEPKGYYLASRDFELPELRLLVDAVQSSKFITEKKSNSLIGKIEKLAGSHYAKELHNQVVVANRIKTMNESIYYNVDKIQSAITSNIKIRFKYCEWTLDKELKPKKDGAFYTVSPWLLNWDDENYYLIAYSEDNEQIRHYRVDKMMNITLTKETRDGKESFAKIDVPSFSKRTFGMFAGEEKQLTIIFSNKLIGVVIDRFGKDVRLSRHDADSFAATVKVNISAQFYGWLAALGDGAKITEPKEEADNFIQFVKKITEFYVT
ncbi:MAG: WYL domain-containing transcriptional regulator [Clostridia bacterium]|nr:WYL domain-containing transcriptional regulator [Clostridia bacterium]